MNRFSGDPAGQRKEIASRHRPNNEWSPVAALENTVSRMQQDLEELQTETRFLRDAEGTRTRAPGAASGTHDDKGCPGLMDQPVGNSINKCLMR